LIAFAVAWGLFRILESTAVINKGWLQLTGGAAGFVIVFWRLWAMYEREYPRQIKRHEETLRSQEIARQIAILNADNIVIEARKSENVIAALDTTYFDTKDQLKDYFWKQDKSWLEFLLKELRTQTMRKISREWRDLREWQPKKVSPDFVVDL
jgi:hypothetical protein